MSRVAGSSCSAHCIASPYTFFGYSVNICVIALPGIEHKRLLHRQAWSIRGCVFLHPEATANLLLGVIFFKFWQPEHLQSLMLVGAAAVGHKKKVFFAVCELRVPATRIPSSALAQVHSMILRVSSKQNDPMILWFYDWQADSDTDTQMCSCCFCSGASSTQICQENVLCCLGGPGGHTYDGPLDFLWEPFPL